jgi:hypothetical protein
MKVVNFNEIYFVHCNNVLYHVLFWGKAIKFNFTLM